jgi:ceramide glucosyltransferase
MLLTLLFVLSVASCGYWLLTAYLIYDFFRVPPAPEEPYAVPVSILKPVRDVDPQAYENFVSFCRQDYEEFELLFAVADPTDPVIRLIERLQQDFPTVAIRLIIAPPFGANRKASLLHYLATQALYEVLVISDSDIRVTPDYLRRVVAPMKNRKIGMVTCPYRGEQALTFTARLEALYMGATFVPLVLAARKYVAMRLGLGATMVVRRSDVDRIGGFAALADYLGDDYQLGRRIAGLGLQVQLSHYVVACVLGATTFRDQWNREVRWMRNARVSRPREYPIIPLTFSTPLAVSLVLLTGFDGSSLWVLVMSLAIRWLVAWLVTGHTGDLVARRWMLWLPLRDMLTALVWCTAAFGRRVVWRGEAYMILPDGKMVPQPPSESRVVMPGPIGRP